MGLNYRGRKVDQGGLGVKCCLSTSTALLITFLVTVSRGTPSFDALARETTPPLPRSVSIELPLCYTWHVKYALEKVLSRAYLVRTPSLEKS